MQVRVARNPETGEWSVGIKGYHPSGQKIGFFETFKEEPSEAQIKAVHDSFERLKTLSEEEITSGMKERQAFMDSLCPTCYKKKTPQ